MAGSLSGARIEVPRWPSERPLFAVAVAVSVLLWLLLTVSVIGLIYAVMIGAFFFVMHLGFVAYVRGSAVRLGPDQFPELHARVQELAHRFGIERVPDAYLMQGGGVLNAFATRFLRSHLVVLYSDLLEACGEDTAARDMIIAHELGHIHAGHLRWRWLTLPASVLPFLGTALSRAREYTCDRYGLAGAGEREGALLGLTILAAGGKQARQVNRAAFVRQRAELNTGWMTIGEWLSTHPPLVKRLAALDPTLTAGERVSSAGALRAVAILGTVMLPVIIGSWLAATRLPALMQGGGQGVGQEATGPVGMHVAPDSEAAMAEAERGFERLSTFLEAERQAGRALPADLMELHTRWQMAHPTEEMPLDPFDGDSYGYNRTPTGYVLWSSGPDRQPNTPDDLVFQSAESEEASG